MNGKSKDFSPGKISGHPTSRHRLTQVNCDYLEGFVNVSCAPVAAPLSRCVAFGIITTVLLVANAKAQDAEPRLYTNTPVGLNFLIGGYLYSEGKIAFDPSSSITDAQFNSQTGVLAYVRSLDVAGKSA